MSKNHLYKKRFKRFHVAKRYKKSHRGFYCAKHKSKRRNSNKFESVWMQFERNVTLVLSQIFPKVNLDILQIVLKSPKGDVEKEIARIEAFIDLVKRKKMRQKINNKKEEILAKC